MKVARLYAPGDLRVEDLPAPEAGPGDLVIRVRTCSTCGTDAKIYRLNTITSPCRASSARGRRRGDRGRFRRRRLVRRRQGADHRAIPDGVCYFCRRGQHTVCEDLESIGYQYDGGFAEFMRVPAEVLSVDGVNRVPDHVPFGEA